MRKILFALVPATLLAIPNASAQHSAYVPEPGVFELTATHQFQRYRDFWVGGTRIGLEAATGFEVQQQHSTFLTVEYGLAPNLAIDATVGYTWAEFKHGPGGVELNDDGLTDTSVGLRYRVIDERNHSGAPTFTIRFGGIAPGTYDDDFPFSSGDGAGGFEASALVAKQFLPGLGVYGEFGYRWRDHDVPEELFGAAGVWVGCRGVTFSVGYRQSESLDGPDIGDPGFGVDFGFPQTREIDKRIESALGYTDSRGRYYGAFFSATFEGRNTGEKYIYGVNVSIPFGGGETPLPPPAYYGKK